MKRRDLLKISGAGAGMALLPVAAYAGDAALKPLANAVGAAIPSLPQANRSIAATALRQAAIAGNQLIYSWTASFTNVPGIPMASGVPLADYPTVEWLLEAAPVLVELLINIVASLPGLLVTSLPWVLPGLQQQLDSLQATVSQAQTSYSQLLATNGGNTHVDALTALQVGQLQQSLQKSLSQVATLFNQVIFTIQTELANSSGLLAGAGNDELARFKALFATIPLPAIAGEIHDDETFAYLRVGGPNPLLLARVTTLPAKFPLSDTQYRQVISNDDLASAAAAGRLYLLDYAPLNGMAAANPTTKLLTGTAYTNAPIALFARPPGATALVPVAIQNGQDPAIYPIVLRASDPASPAYWSWQSAKTIVQQADFNYHEWFVHLPRTHLVSEALCVATHRNLAPNHPLSVLLLPHFEGDLFINAAAALFFFPKTIGIADVVFASPLNATLGLVGEGRLGFDLYAQRPPADFKARGVDDSNALPDYPYRDDALLIWNAIKAWVADYVAVYYSSDADVLADTELAAWSHDLLSNGKVIVPPIVNRELLIEIVSMVIFTASAQHAAVNYPQFSEMTYAPAFPGAIAVPAPTSASGASEADWAKLLPTTLGSLVQFYVLSLLGSIYYRPLGNYQTNNFPYPSALVDPRIVAAGGPLQRFQQALVNIESTITSRNSQRSRPYPYLLPSKIPSSTNI